MSKNVMNVAKTVGIGLLAGTTAMAVGTVMMNQKSHKKGKNKMKSTAASAVHTMGEIMGNVEAMLK